MNAGRIRKYQTHFAGALLLLFAPALTIADNNPTHEKWVCTTTEKKDGWACHLDTPSQKSLSQALGWIPDTTDTLLQPNGSESCNTCGGHYYLPPVENPADASKPIDSVPSNITADKADYHITGAGTLTGNVKVVQPGRVLKADTATIYQATLPGETHKKVNRITAQGSLSVRQPDTLVLADHLDADLFSHKTEVENAHYLMQLKPGFSGTLPGDTNFTGFAHGAADTAYQRSQNVYDFYHASYATCPPDDDTWVLHAKHIQLNRAVDRGYATNVWLTAHGVPVFYSPYFSFPLDKSRQSGFLYGSVGYKGGPGNGGWFSLPYYFNLAPNYDDTLTTSVYQQRGVLFSNQARFLTRSSTGNLNFQYIYDTHLHESRGSAAYAQHTQLSPDWTLGGHFNYLSDKDFLSDFQNSYGVSGISAGGNPTPGLATENNVAVLPRDLTLSYTGPHWTWQNTVSQYQIVDKTFSLDNRPYNLLPQSTLSGSFPATQHSHNPFDLKLFSQFTNFQKSASDTAEAINGQRLLINPSVGLPLTTPYGFLTPTVVLNMSSYQLQNLPNTGQYPDTHIDQAIPQLNLQTGLYFDRHFGWFGDEYSQTLEPKLMYLYTPDVDQNRIPSFDTAPVSFDYNQLFALNRFSGYDRIGNANQLTYALETTVQNAGGGQVLSAGVGQIYYFKDRHTTVCYPSGTCITTENPTYQQDTSPIASQLSFALYDDWHFNLSEAFNTHTRDWSYQSYGLQYLPNPQHVVNLNYVVNQSDYSLLTRDQILQGLTPPKSQQITASTIWKFTPIWHVLANWDYSITHHRTVSEFAAFEYNACCFAVEFGIYRYLLTDNPNAPNDLTGNLQTGFVAQILLKGLGGIGQSNFEALAEQIPGYSPASQI